MPSKLEVVIMAVLRVSIATICTVAGMVAIAYLAKMLGISKSLTILLSIIAGVSGFIFGIYWTMTYLAKSGYAKTKISTTK
jgi:positive regulator of sigma E activity